MRFVPTSITQTAARSSFRLHQQSPHIAFGAGLAGAILTTVMAVRATRRAEDKYKAMENSMENLNDLKQGVEVGTYSEADLRKDTATVVMRHVLDIGKDYVPTILVGGASILLLCSSHRIMLHRNAALLSTVAAVHDQLKTYRARVREEIGEERENHVYQGFVEVDTIDPETLQTVRSTIHDAANLSIYARLFDRENSTHWDRDPEMNNLYITCQENLMNRKLGSRGHVFLNEVYDALGFPRTTEGQIVGWVLEGDGDNYIDFGRYVASNGGYPSETVELLDFNVDGPIVDRI